ncbi:hypothetical protein Dsin_013735 [Dipteronia sinensis]|uniref:Uncharacterized protein n=1 Tax=Dipteronia sinensis TaxID=43782 RepID=A0AAE0ALI4_9ROSI|nr:hypothetical protein Dsin_013735 [Dipteronia sinensis]
MSYVARRKYKGRGTQSVKSNISSMFFCTLQHETDFLIPKFIAEKWWLSLSIAAGVVLLVPLLCYLCYIALRKLKAEEKKQWIRLIVSGVGALLAILLCSLSYLSRRKHKEENWWMSLTVAIGIALVIPLFCYLCYLAWRKIKDKGNYFKQIGQ